MLLPVTADIDIESLWDIERDRLIFRPSESWTVIDCGAHIGISTLIYALQCRQGMVIAVEPNLYVLPKLYENINKAGVSNIKVLPVACAELDGHVILYVAKVGIASSLIKDYADSIGGGVIYSFPVRAMRIDSIMRIMGINKVDLLLLDVEGIATSILKSHEQLLKSCLIKRIKVDLDYRDKREIQQLVNFLRQYYRVYIIERNLYAHCRGCFVA